MNSLEKEVILAEYQVSRKIPSDKIREIFLYPNKEEDLRFRVLQAEIQAHTKEGAK